MSTLGLICILLLPWHTPLTRDDSLETVTESESSESETYFETVQSEADKLSLLDDLLWRQDHPFDLNTVTSSELESIPGVTPNEAAEVLRWRRRIGGFRSLLQIGQMDEVGEELYSKLAPYVTIKRQPPLVRLRSRVSRDLQPRRGYLDSTFLGSSLKSYGRLSIEAEDFRMGAVAEKDGGERLANGFISGYIEGLNMGPLSQAVVGDFNVEAGQGLVLSRGSSLGKSGEPVGMVKRSGLGIRPSLSTDEFNYFRGAAASASLLTGGAELRVTTLFSRRTLDGSMDTLHEVTGFYEAGLFQTENDLRKRDAVTEQVVGGRIELVGDKGWRIGSTGCRTVFDKRIRSDREFEFAGRTQDVLGLDAAVTAGRVSAFGEVATSGERAIAGIVGTILNVGAGSNVALVYRDYGAAFNNIHASGFGEHADVKNERGFYVGADIRVVRWLRLSGYVDQFRFPWRTYLNPLPTVGHEVFLQGDAAVSPQIGLSARFSSKSTEGAEADVDAYGRETRVMAGRSQEKYRTTMSYKASRQITVKGRLEYTEVRYPQLDRKEQGYLLFQNVRYAIPGRFSVEGRLVFFQTDSYDSRVYEYENDIRGVFSNPGLYGKGRRWYVVFCYTASPVVTLSVKYSETQKEGVTSIGSGASEVRGDMDNRMGVQIDLSL